MNWSALLVALVPLAVVTVTLTVPVPAGEVAVQDEAAQDTPVAAVVPKATLLRQVRPGHGDRGAGGWPVDGLTPVTAGAGGGAAA